MQYTGEYIKNSFKIPFVSALYSVHQILTRYRIMVLYTVPYFIHVSLFYVFHVLVMYHSTLHSCRKIISPSF